MKWSVILLLSVPTSIDGISCFRCTFLLIPIGGRSWPYKLLCKCMKCGYEKEQIWSEKLNWRMKLQTYQFGHTKATQVLLLHNIAYGLGLSYEGSKKKRKNTYLLTRCGRTFEHIYEKILQFVSIRERMWKMHFIRSRYISTYLVLCIRHSSSIIMKHACISILFCCCVLRPS